jgi:hypothetical protein
MSGDCSLINNNLYIKPVETCTFAALYRFNNKSFGVNNNYIDKTHIYTDGFKRQYTDINANFREHDNKNKFIYKYNNNKKKDLCFPIKENDNNSPYAINCVILTGNPLYTYDKTKKACTIIPELKFNTSSFKYSENKDYIYHDNTDDPEGKYSYNKKDKSGYCENKWYDWIITPNYHFGNSYLKDSGAFSKEDVKVCYAPCEKGKMPYIDINTEYKCVNKKIAENGLYEKKMDYSPIALINLIGNSQKSLAELYILMSLYKYKDNAIANYEIIDDRTISNSECKIKFTTGEISECKENKTKDNIYNNFNEVRDAYKEISDIIMKNIINVDTLNDKKKYKNYPNLITYQNPYFEENDNQSQQLTLLGLDNNKMLIDEILIHTFKIAYNISEFIENTIFTNKFIIKKDNQYTIETDDSKIEYNIENNLINLLDKNDIYRNKDENTKINIRKRLANILYKAILVCYDNKTDFSKNIITKTKAAIDRYTSPDKKPIVINYLTIKQKYPFSHHTSTASTDTEYNAETTAINAKITKVVNDGINITFYLTDTDTDTVINSKITANFPASTTSTQEQELIKNLLKKYHLCYKTEPIEESICGNNKIYDVEKNSCVECSSYCNPTENKCENPRCKLYCNTLCTEAPTIEANRIVGKTACGDIKTQKPNDDGNKDNKTKYSETPLGENNFDFFSLFNNSIKSAMSIVFFLIILYIIYIVYEVFGESLLLLFNFISYWFILIFKTIIATVKAIFSGNFSAIPRYVAFDLAEYEKNTNINRYERVSTKLFTKPS